MNTFIFNKLVRDNIVPNMEREGVLVNYTTAVWKELFKVLSDKLEEEFSELEEVLESPTEAIIGELADIMQVIESRIDAGGDPREMMPYQNEINKLMTQNKISREEVLTEQKNKMKRKWGFSQGHVIATVRLDEGSPRYKYISEHYSQEQ